VSGISSIGNSSFYSSAAYVRPAQREEIPDVSKLRSTDAEVRANLQRAAQRAGVDGYVTPQVTYSVGPDGQRYATGGTVQISRVIKGPRGLGDLSDAPSARDIANEPVAVNDNTPRLNRSDVGQPSLANLLAPQLNLSSVDFAKVFGQEYAESSALSKLRKADAGVRNHEAQHYRAAGGLVTGLPEYDYVEGPDGQSYAVGGSVDVKTTSTSDPEKARRDSNSYYNAAVAPGDASSADLGAARGALSRAAEAYGKLNTSQNQIDFAA